jgi:hypothetical protein
LLDYVAERSSGCRVARAAGVQAEMELAYAGLHHLCAPMLDGMRTLPAPQREALAVAFGLREGSAPDRFLVALAVLTLLAGAAEAQPLVCVVDDAQWLDRASAQVLAFVARRLLAERIAMVFAVRESGDAVKGSEPADAGELADLPQLRVEGLPAADAQWLLESSVPGLVDARVRERILAETRGNPLALRPARACVSNVSSSAHSVSRPSSRSISTSHTLSKFGSMRERRVVTMRLRAASAGRRRVSPDERP